MKVVEYLNEAAQGKLRPFAPSPIICREPPSPNHFVSQFPYFVFPLRPFLLFLCDLKGYSDVLGT